MTISGLNIFAWNLSNLIEAYILEKIMERNMYMEWMD